MVTHICTVESRPPFTYSILHNSDMIHFLFLSLSFLIFLFTIKHVSAWCWLLGSILLCINIRHLIREGLKIIFIWVWTFVSLFLIFNFFFCIFVFLQVLFIVGFKKYLGFMLWTRSVFHLLPPFFMWKGVMSLEIKKGDNLFWCRFYVIQFLIFHCIQMTSCFKSWHPWSTLENCVYAHMCAYMCLHTCARVCVERVEVGVGNRSNTTFYPKIGKATYCILLFYILTPS